MINVLIAYDNQDKDLGEFCLQCYYHVFQYFQNKNGYNPIFIDSNILTKKNIENTIANFDGNTFICLAYSHGTEDALCCDNENYVDLTNSYFFGNSFFYTFSCNSAKELGERLIDEGCKSFIGFENEALIVFEKVSHFVECANYGIIRFFEGENAVTAFNQMIDNYDETIDRLREEEDKEFPFIAELTKNRNALTFLGDENITIEYFNNPQ
jgi:hypothetical protein